MGPGESGADSRGRLRRAEASRLARLIWPFVAIVILLAALVSASIDVMSAVRAYVGGESLWSKAQKDAVGHLARYARTGDEEQYHAYIAATAVIEGDRRAREELQKPDPDTTMAGQGFLEGGNSPDDIPGMIALFRHFQHIGFMERAIAIWSEADTRMADLARIGQDLRAAAAAGALDSRATEEALKRIRVIDAKLTVLERAFSATLSEASRTVATL